MDAEIGNWANYSCTVESTESNSFKWCLAIPGSKKICCAPPEILQYFILQNLNNTIEIECSYSDSRKTSHIKLKVTEELDGTVVQCQHGSPPAIARSKMSLLLVESVSEAEVDVEDVDYEDV